jgi:hypothetical protein
MLLTAGVVSALLVSDARAATPSGALTVRFDVDPGTVTTHTVQFLAVGAVPAESVKLVDSEGKHAVTASKQSDAKACETAAKDERDTGLGDDAWCVKLEGVRAGQSVSGKLAGDGAVVKLTLTARDAWYGPVIAAIIAALVAAALVWTTTYGLSSIVTSKRLKGVVRRHKAKIGGLEAWNEEAADRLTESQRLERVIWMRDRGVPHLKRMRAALKKEVEGATADGIPDNPLLVAARSEAERSDMKVEDLVGPDDEVAVSAAEELLGLVRTVRAGLDDFEAQVELLLPQVPAGKKAEAEATIAVVRQSLTTLSPLRVTQVLDGMQQAIGQLVEYTAPTDRAAFAAVGISGGARAAAARVSAVVASPRVRGFVDAAGASAAVVVTVLLLMALVVATAVSANWAPKQTFAGFWDYAALVVSVFGSATITGIVSATILLGRTQGRRPGT